MKKNYAFVAAGLGLAQLVLLSTATHAQDTTRVLDKVVVTASRSPKKSSDIGRVVTVITAADISHAQGKSLPELLNTVPGITFSGAENTPGISSAVYTRGASTGNTLVLVDGFPVNNAGAIAGAYDLNAFPLDQIDHIEILKGTGSTLYGSDAVAGVVNIITKHAIGNGLKNNIQLAGGTYNTFNEAYGLNGKLNKTGIAINLSNTDSKGFPAATDATGDGNFKNDDYHQRSASVNLKQEVSDKFQLSGNFQGTYNNGSLPQGAFADDKNYHYGNKFMLAGAGAKWQLKKGELNVNLSQNSVASGYTDIPSVENGSVTQVINNVGRVTNAEALFTYQINKYLDLSSGTNFKYSSTNQYSLYNAPGYTPPPNIFSGSNHIFSAFTSLFLKADIFHMELGGRFNHHSAYGDNFTYTINPSVLLADQFKVFVTAASAFKAPSLYQLTSPQYGVADLRPETTTSYEAGFDWEIVKNALNFSTVFYKNNTSNVIYFYSQPVFPYKSYYKNGDFQHDKGYETELKYHNALLTASAYLAYVTGDMTDANGLTTDNLYRRPKFTAGANAYYQFCSVFSAGLTYKFTGDRVDENFDTYPTTYPILKHYNLVDVHLQYQATKKLNLFADLKNLLDEKYTDWLGYNTRRFNFMAGLRYQL